MYKTTIKNITALPRANQLLLALNITLLVILAIALIITEQQLIPAFHDIQWFTSTVLASNFFYFALTGTIFIYAAIYCWYLNKDWHALIIGIILAILLILVSSTQYNNSQSIIKLSIVTIWMCCLINLLWRAFTSGRPERDILINLLLTLTLPSLFLLLATFFLGLTIAFHPQTQDQLLMALDATLGFNPTFLAGQLFAKLPLLLFDLIKFVYLALPLSLAIIYVARYFCDQQPPVEFIIEFFLIGLGGMLLYHINTGCGPINAFKGIWPQQLPVIPLKPALQLCMGGFLPRNCLPSLHTAWAVCLWRHSLRCNKSIRWLIAGWVVCTLLGTMGLGEHYLVDLLVGFAFATMIGGICAINLPLKQSARRNAIIFAGVICCCWYLIINTGLNFLRLSPIIAWSCYLSSIYLTGILEYKLMVAQRLITLEPLQPTRMQ